MFKMILKLKKLTKIVLKNNTKNKVNKMNKKITNQLTLLYFKSTFLNSLPNVGISSHFEMGISLTFLHQ